ncbi:hypothetical protein ACHAXT_007501 [Thalassiosira profunda]
MDVAGELTERLTNCLQGIEKEMGKERGTATIEDLVRLCLQSNGVEFVPNIGRIYSDLDWSYYLPDGIVVNKHSVGLWENDQHGHKWGYDDVEELKRMIAIVDHLRKNHPGKKVFVLRNNTKSRGPREAFSVEQRKQNALLLATFDHYKKLSKEDADDNVALEYIDYDGESVHTAKAEASGRFSVCRLTSSLSDEEGPGSNTSQAPRPGRAATYFSFDDRLQHLAAYKRLHGHTQVREREDRSLHQFCKRARAARKNPRLKGWKLGYAERMAKLDAMGFDWTERAQVLKESSRRRRVTFSVTVGGSREVVKQWGALVKSFSAEDREIVVDRLVEDGDARRGDGDRLAAAETTALEQADKAETEVEQPQQTTRSGRKCRTDWKSSEQEAERKREKQEYDRKRYLERKVQAKKKKPQAKLSEAERKQKKKEANRKQYLKRKAEKSLAKKRKEAQAKKPPAKKQKK